MFESFEPEKRMGNLYHILLSLVIMCLVISNASGADKSKPSANVPLSQAQIKQLKDLGVLVGRNESWDKVEKGWKTFLEQSKDIDVDTAVTVVTQEATEEAGRSIDPSKKRLQQLTLLKGAVVDELGRAQALLSESKQRKQKVMINKKEFEVFAGEPPKIVVKPGEVISSQGELEEYIRQLAGRQRLIDNDIRGITMEMSNVTQRRQTVLNNLPEIEKKLHETAKRVKLPLF
jgi:hypothetical protein